MSVQRARERLTLTGATAAAHALGRGGCRHLHATAGALPVLLAASRLVLAAAAARRVVVVVGGGAERACEGWGVGG